MAQEKKFYLKPHATIGVIGHTNHGKTTLTAAILATQSKRMMAKAISYANLTQGGEVIDEDNIVTVTSVSVEYESPKRCYTQIDCPGRAEYTENTVASMAQINGAILVVSALNFLETQTREHVRLAREVGVPAITVYMNKCDALVDDPDMLDMVEMETRELLSANGFDGENAPVIRGAALPALQGDSRWIESIDKLLDALDRYIPQPEN